ncbi:MAG: hypothetical protein E7192_00490 [Erysipelotrichaceae bacterium]|nr:hypothetical protein [Erysipelotrichaceae bacterium]
MDQSSHELREQHWMTIIQQCNRESKEEGITKLEWMKETTSIIIRSIAGNISYETILHPNC